MTTSHLADVPIRSADDLDRRMARLLDPPVFSARSLRVTWLGGDGCMLRTIVPIDDVPPSPDPRLLANLVQFGNGMIEDHLDGEGHLAMALCRPGRAQPTGDDHEWAESLRRAFDGDLRGTWSLHLAAGHEVTLLVPAPESVWR